MNYLVEEKKNDWEGCFAIAIFPNLPWHWLKLHLYRWQAPFWKSKWLPLSSVEGMGKRSEALFAAAIESETAQEVVPFAPASLRWADSSWVRSPQQRWQKAEGGYTIRFRADEQKSSGELAFLPRHHYRWIHLPGLLQYTTGFGEVTATLLHKGKQIEGRGLGLIEKASGTSLPVDVSRFWSAFHWDVLCWSEELQPISCAAYLVASPRFGKPLFLRGTWVEDKEVASVQQGKIAYRSVSVTGEPRLWEGEIKLKGQRLTYRARALHRPLHLFSGGGFLGFSFQGVLFPSKKKVQGKGFAEYKAALQGAHG